MSSSSRKQKMCKNTIATAPTSNRSRSRSKTRSSHSSPSKPAFPDAKFDKNGCCIVHDTVVLAEQIRQDGRLLWKEVKMTCPKCASEHHKSRRVTSLGGAGKIKRGRTVHGQHNPLRDSKKGGRKMDVEFDTPFDELGRCHHHPNVQMATKKVRGGWKVLMRACPKCIEVKYEEDCISVASSKSGGSRHSRRSKGRNDNDDGSVSSRSSKRSVTSRNPAVSPGAKFDKNGCCTGHPTLQIAKKKLLGGWKEFRSCPKCLDPSYDDMSEVASVSSRRSNTSFRSTGSRKSSRSVKSSQSRKGGRKTDRYGMLPFDEEGYCHAHPSVRIAKKKTLGGWKVIHDICPDCANDASSNAGSTRSRGSSRRSSGTGRYFDGSGSDASSFKSDRSGGSSSRKVKIRVKAMKYQDVNGKEGRYSGDVNEDHQPHGHGKIKYKDGTAFDGVWSEGAQVHGKSYKAKSSKKGSSSDKKKDDWSSGKREAEGGKKVVKRMKWLDYYGDPGEYSGEVDSSGLPHGKGSMKYDHGLIQEGLWRKGQYLEGSDEEVGEKNSAKATTSSRRKEP